MTTHLFSEAVATRYHIYNSLFLNLPFRDIYKTGTLLPLLHQHCEKGFEASKDPASIIASFFQEFVSTLTLEEQHATLFQFIQFIERQVVLFDSIEDAAFEEVQDVNGRGTVSALLLRAKSEGKEDELKKILAAFRVNVVLTAHPTQFYPGSVLAILTDLEQAIRLNNLNQINLLLRQLGKTKFINKKKPTPYDEAMSLCWFLENVFYESIPAIVQKLAVGLDMDVAGWVNPKLLTVGFWPGGDRDGNPFVTNEITKAVVAQLHERIIRNYYREVRALRRRLTFKGVDLLILGIENKLNGNLQKSEDRYGAAGELIEDLMKARKVLIQEHDGLFLDLLDKVILKVKLFGFHFASLDIRQDSRRHTAMWASLLKISPEAWRNMKEDEKVRTILESKSQSLHIDEGNETLKEDLGVFRIIGEIQNRVGPEGCHRYIISNCSSASNVMEVFQLARIFTGAKPSLDIIPLFESIEDLAQAGHIMSALYQNTLYKEHLSTRSNRQVIMLGFSDGTKDGGYLRANISIFRAKEELTRISKLNGIQVVFFDGRGGPPARGGGNTHDFYASLGPTIETSEVEITIQGQTISSNFGRIASCTYNLEQLLSAGVENEIFASVAELTDSENQLIDALASAAYEAYLGLKNHPAFVPYLQKVTPLPYFGESNIGSRPMKRSVSSELRLEDLRAIPFVGTWAQMKQNIPGFYGAGMGLQEMFKGGKGDAMKLLYKKSLFFRTLLGNSMMSLTKTFYPATAHLAKDAEFGAIWKMMFDEFILSKKMILEVSGQAELMQASQAGRESIRLREKIVLPLIGIQQYALQKLRQSPQNPDVYVKLVVRSMFGIINAARNSA